MLIDVRNNARHQANKGRAALFRMCIRIAETTILNAVPAVTRDQSCTSGTFPFAQNSRQDTRQEPFQVNAIRFGPADVHFFFLLRNGL